MTAYAVMSTHTVYSFSSQFFLIYTSLFCLLSSLTILNSSIFSFTLLIFLLFTTYYYILYNLQLLSSILYHTPIICLLHFALSINHYIFLMLWNYSFLLIFLNPNFPITYDLLYFFNNSISSINKPLINLKWLLILAPK